MGFLDKAKEAGVKAKEAGMKARERSLDFVNDEKLADIIIKALKKQEGVNKELAKKGSKYRINDVSVELGIPPTISFSINQK